MRMQARMRRIWMSGLVVVVVVSVSAARPRQRGRLLPVVLSAAGPKSRYSNGRLYGNGTGRSRRNGSIVISAWRKRDPTDLLRVDRRVRMRIDTSAKFRANPWTKVGAAGVNPWKGLRINRRITAKRSAGVKIKPPRAAAFKVKAWTGTRKIASAKLRPRAPAGIWIGPSTRLRVNPKTSFAISRIDQWTSIKINSLTKLKAYAHPSLNLQPYRSPTSIDPSASLRINPWASRLMNHTERLRINPWTNSEINHTERLRVNPWADPEIVPGAELFP